MFGLEKMRVARLRCIFRSEGTAVLPPFLGSTLRGAVAGAMREMFCCGDCEKKGGLCEGVVCPFAFCFSPSSCVGTATQRRIEEPPRPLFFVAPPIRSPVWRLGQLLSFGVVMVGDAVQFSSSVVASLQMAAEKGLGAERVPFSLLSVSAQVGAHHECLLWEEGRLVCSSVPAVSLGEVFSFQREATDTIRVRFLSPLRLLKRGKLLDTPCFRSFLHALLGRLSSLLSVYCAGALEVDFRDVLRRAQRVETLRCEIEESPMQRWSNRQHKKIPIDGIVGSVLWKGEILPQIWPLLEAGSWLHCGKGTSFGLGQYTAELACFPLSAQRTA